MATTFVYPAKYKPITSLLILACTAAFFGRAWQHLRWDPPYRALLWSEETMKPLISGILGIPWETYVSDPAIEQWLQGSVRLVGLLLLFAGCITLLSCKAPRFLTRVALTFGIAVSASIAFCYYRESGSRIGEFLEFFSQIGAPLLLLLGVYHQLGSRSALWIARIAVSATFLGHAAYAIGYYPEPRTFTTMVMNIFRWDEPAAIAFLRIAGWIDIAIAILVLLPRVAGFALIYAAVWGALTALARITAHYSPVDPLQSISQWGFETLVRVPNAILPIVALLQLRQMYSQHRQQVSPAPQQFPTLIPSHPTPPA